MEKSKETRWDEYDNSKLHTAPEQVVYSSIPEIYTSIH